MNLMGLKTMLFGRKFRLTLTLTSSSDSDSDSDSELDAIYGIYSIPTIDGESEQDI